MSKKQIQTLTRRDVSPADFELSQQQGEVITLLLAGKSQTEAAGAVGITPETISRWKNTAPGFVAELNKQRRAQFEDTISQLDALAVKAFGALGDLLQSADERTRLDAVKVYLGYRGQLTPPAGEVDPALVLKRWLIDDQKHATELFRAEVFSGI